MEESTCHEKVIHLSQKFNSMLFFFPFFIFFFNSLKCDFDVDVERMIVKTREM